MRNLFGIRAFRETMSHALHNRPEEVTVLLWIALILFVLWLLGFIALPSLGGIVHILIVLAVIALIVHFVMGRRAT
jgi:uncharacterized membrane protein (DUF485 family)